MIRQRQQVGLLLGTAISLVGLPMAAIAEDEIVRWDLTPYVSLSQIYTDNVGLRPPGQEDREHITQTDIGFSLAREGSRANANMAYNLQHFAYWRDDRRNNTFHQFAGEGQFEAVAEHLFLDARATYSQRLQSRRDNVAVDNVNSFAANDRSDVLTWRISPNYIQRMGNVATGRLRYSHERVDFQDSSVDEFSSETDRVSANLDSGTMFSTISWGLSFQRSETDYKDGSAVTFQTAEALLRLNVTDRLSLFAAGGEEDNEFEQDASRARPDDTFWRAGFNWQPGSRTDMEAYYGERFFGETFGGSFNHRFRNSEFSMEYSEGLMTVTDFDIDRVVIPIVDDAGSPVIVDGNPVFMELEIPDLQTGVYLRERFSLGFSGERRKLSWSLRGFNERREFELTDRSERLKGVGTNLAWRIGARTRLLLNGRVQETTYQEDDREDEYYIYGTGLQRDAGPNTSVALNYRYTERTSNQPGNEFVENRVTASFRKTF
ncbi:TIGR03016 family PEP-CTERM system-associated outer membrane protein [Thiohalophilus sp.]|uniref:TIGR03016 family PEP-CTERM system-associated outer membrane protein n=1 Tax=Thiohalophilus sp. TaxID=3028392 RepID=UPI002ACDE986|nr:TIGR03016 family PEP-CTERM system-associated outer membrane protein [Thiohalophilus sp.]MDZ7803461.1 TIGR03016 family PEP-CTERM system-associated outer membrane protein [Thiohalophilus sp.]